MQNNIEQTESNNILDQLANYNSSDIEYQISYLREEIRNQKRLNEALQNKNATGNVKEVSDFLARNAAHIADQLSRYKELTDQLKSIVLENHDLEMQEDEYVNLLASSNAQQVASNLSAIKSLKDDISFFLRREGIAFAIR